MSTPFQLFDALPAHIEDALRASIERFGVLVPVVRDQHGNTIDGHHRARLADQLGVKYRVDLVTVTDEDEAREIARTLNADRRMLDEDQRKAVAVQLRKDGHSIRAIAGALGVPQATAQRDTAGVSPDTPGGRARGKDGKSYPSSRPTVVAAKNEREAERAQQALAVLGDDAPSVPVLDVKRLERVARETEAERRRAEPVEQRTISVLVDLRHGDFRQALDDIAPRTVDAIITDPPYLRDYWHLYEDLAILARDLLNPNGVLAVMTGTRLEMLDTVDALMGKHLRRRCRAVYLTPGQRWRDQLERVAVGYKPILIYAHPDATDLRWINDDVFTSSGTYQADQRFHHWGQNEEGFASLVERLTEPGQLVVDPFLGGGTTALVCRDLGRRFIGCDVDAAAVTTSRERVDG